METCFQLDMTTFYSADKAIDALCAGRVAGAYNNDLRINISNLALVLVVSLFYDNILVPVPAVLDEGPRNDFAPDPSELSCELLNAGVVKVMNLDEPTKKKTRKLLTSDTESYLLPTIDFFSNLDNERCILFNNWAEYQLKNKKIVGHTRDEEEASEFHQWTQNLVANILGEIIKKDTCCIKSVCPQSNLEHIIRTAIRGYIYEASGQNLSTYYLPHFVREGLLGHTKNPMTQAKTAKTICNLAVPIDDLASAFQQSRGLDFEVPTQVALLEKVAIEKSYSSKGIADLICRERETSGNIALRKKLQQAAKKKHSDLIVQEWFDILECDRQIWRGQKLPRVFELIPTVIQLIPGIKPDKVEELLDFVPGIRTNKTFFRKLRTPLYFNKHMRYLWHLLYN